MSELSSATDRQVLEEILDHVRSLSHSRADEEEAEHVLCVAETAHYLIGLAIGSLSRAGSSAEEISTFLEPVETQLRLHLSALGLVPGDSMNLTSVDGRHAADSYPKPLKCDRCSTFILECDCE